MKTFTSIYTASDIHINIVNKRQGGGDGTGGRGPNVDGKLHSCKGVDPIIFIRFFIFRNHLSTRYWEENGYPMSF